MRNKVGQAVSGADYFDRPAEQNKIIRALRADANVLISSPRRIGKTSILYKLVDSDIEGFHFLYIITQSIKTEDDFYRRLYETIIDNGAVTTRATKIGHKAKDALRSALNRVKGVKGVELREGKGVDYKERFFNTMRAISLDDRKIVILVDEFTQTVENIVRSGGKDQALNFLQALREFRHDETLRQNLLFVFTGSVGLENVAGRIEASDLISDLTSIKVAPLKDKEATKLLGLLLEGLRLEGIILHAEAPSISYALKKIEWLIPFHIQALVQEIGNLAEAGKSTKVTKKMVDMALDGMLQHRNHFDLWQNRLKKSLSTPEYRFAEEVLSAISRKNVLSSNEVLNLGVKHDLRDDYKQVVRVLIHDGYINNNDQPEVYRFNSPVLRRWWYENCAC